MVVATFAAAALAVAARFCECGCCFGDIAASVVVAAVATVGSRCRAASTVPSQACEYKTGQTLMVSFWAGVFGFVSVQACQRACFCLSCDANSKHQDPKTRTEKHPKDVFRTNSGRIRDANLLIFYSGNAT